MDSRQDRPSHLWRSGQISHFFSIFQIAGIGSGTQENKKPFQKDFGMVKNN
jgi:hypothetical protein